MGGGLSEHHNKRTSKFPEALHDGTHVDAHDTSQRAMHSAPRVSSQSDSEHSQVGKGKAQWWYYGLSQNGRVVMNFNLASSRSL